MQLKNYEIVEALFTSIRIQFTKDTVLKLLTINKQLFKHKIFQTQLAELRTVQVDFNKIVYIRTDCRCYVNAKSYSFTNNQSKTCKHIMCKHNVTVGVIQEITCKRQPDIRNH